ncbi:MAG: SDR family NAD(P)-dependent oxidoreductase [Rhodospirillaceae bacterium]|nr:SDR family NAD(P)-dependent oxidoreductase [Rhodospirillaceae bacterium]
MDWRPTLAGKVFIVTGAGNGLGRAHALALAAAGAMIVVNNRWRDQSQRPSADVVVDEIKAAGGQGCASLHAVEDPASGAAMVALALDRFGRLDGVVANAGVPEAASFGRMTLEAFRAVFDVNFLGTLHVVHAAWRVLLAQKSGRVVVSTSSAGLHGNRGMAGYSSSKAALIGLTRALALEGEAANVKINAVAPYAATAMTAAYISSEAARHLTPEAPAALVAWLMSEACDVSGRVLIAGGDWLRHARMVEGDIVQVGGDIAQAVHAAMASPRHTDYAHATAAFQAFLEPR